MLALKDVRIDDPFWSPYQTLVRNTVIPYQWQALNDLVEGAAPSYAIRNFRIAAGDEEGEFGGLVFQDSDLAKWLEAVGYALATQWDEDLKKLADETIDLIVRAQQPDGYVNTYYTVKEPENRWTNLYECHELYCAGHMMEAAVAYYQATGERKLLDAMCRFADHIDSVFGPEEGKLQGVPGHQEIELALVKLYGVTGEPRYLKLAQFFIEARGQAPNYFLSEWEKRGKVSHWSKSVSSAPNLAYNQSHLPVRSQEVAVGHAVRAMYMYTGMAMLAKETGDASLWAACERLWENVTRRQMYVTGGVGSTHHGEAFSFDYDLPNDTVYAETCASIGLIFFAHAMLANRPASQYADVLERALYNVVIGSMAQDGQHYFYVNPLEVWPEASDKNPGRHHVKAQRQTWFGCACCPPNVARLLSSLGQYIYSVGDDIVYAHLYIGSETTVRLGDHSVHIRMKSDMLNDGTVTLTVTPDAPATFGVSLRLPAWSEKAPVVHVNGQPVDFEVVDGYAVVRREWKPEDQVSIGFALIPQLVEAHPAIRADAGKVAIVRGPIVYCIEAVDQSVPVSSILLSTDEPLTVQWDDALSDTTPVILTQGWTDDGAWEGSESTDGLYRPAARTLRPVSVKAIPYSLWGNRGLGEMTVWVRNRF